MNISIIGSVGVPACYGGFESLVEYLLDFTPSNITYTVICSSHSYVEKKAKYKNALLKYVPLKANGISSILYDIISMILSRKSDILIVLGVSGCMFLPLFKLIYKGKIITNIDGLEWKRDKWNKVARFILHTSEKMAVKYSDIVIGDNKGITDYVLEKYNKNAVLIEYGADHAVPVKNPSFFINFPFVNAPFAVTVCRIEPENNIEPILTAFTNVSVPLKLVIIGNWNNSEYGKALHIKFITGKNIILLDPEYDIEKVNFIRCHAKLYLHGHSAGGTNPSLVEAMHLGLPVFAYDCIYNRATTEDKALYWSNTTELANLLLNPFATNNMGNIMKEIAQRRYTWKIIAAKYAGLY